jgi:hypothetical protein
MATCASTRLANYSNGWCRPVVDTDEETGELRVTSKRVNPNVAARNATDDEIRYRAANGHAYYIQIGPKTTVTWMPKYGLHWCATCNLNECAHTERVAEWQETHPPPVME